MAWIWWKPGDAIDAIARTPILYLGVHRVALDRVAAAHLDGLGDVFGVFARARDRELGQVDVEARSVDARGEVLAHLRRHGTVILAVLEARQRLIVTDRLDEVLNIILRHPSDSYAKSTMTSATTGVYARIDLWIC